MSTSRDSRIGLPLSSVSSTASSRARSWISRAIRNRYLPRSRRGIADQAARTRGGPRPRRPSTSCGPAVGDLGQRLPRSAGLIVLIALAAAVDELAVDEHPVAPASSRAMSRDSGRGRVLARAEQSSSFSPPSRSRGRRSGRCAAGCALHQQVVEQAGRAEPEQVGVSHSVTGHLVAPPPGSGWRPWWCGCRRPASPRAAARCARAKSRTACDITSATGRVAAGLTLPVEVLMKSPPASRASHDARRTLSRVTSSPVSRITFRCASAAGGLHRDDLVEHLAVAPGQERAPVDHHVDLGGAGRDRVARRRPA